MGGSYEDFQELQHHFMEMPPQAQIQHSIVGRQVWCVPATASIYL